MEIPNLPNEEWRPIKGYEDYYMLSNLGRIKSLDRVIPHERYGTCRLKGKLINPSRSVGEGSVQARLYKDNQVECFVISRIVWDTFIGNPPRLIGHLDGDRNNNSTSNLYDMDDPSRKKMIQKKLRSSNLA